MHWHSLVKCDTNISDRWPSLDNCITKTCFSSKNVPIDFLVVNTLNWVLASFKHAIQHPHFVFIYNTQQIVHISIVLYAYIKLRVTSVWMIWPNFLMMSSIGFVYGREWIDQWFRPMVHWNITLPNWIELYTNTNPLYSLE